MRCAWWYVYEVVPQYWCVYKILARKPDKKVRRTVHIYIYIFYCWVCLPCSSLGFIFASFSFINTPWVFVSLNLNLLARWYWTTKTTTTTTKWFRFDSKPNRERKREKKASWWLLQIFHSVACFLYNRNGANKAAFILASFLKSSSIYNGIPFNVNGSFGTKSVQLLFYLICVFVF